MPPPVAHHTQRGAHDRNERPGVRDTGHTRDGQRSWPLGSEASVSSSPLLFGRAGTVHSRIMKLASELPMGRGVNVEEDTTTNTTTRVTMAECDGSNASNMSLGPYRHWPLGIFTAMAVEQLYTGNIYNRQILLAFLSNNMAHERAQSYSPTNSVFSVHKAITGDIKSQNIPTGTPSHSTATPVAVSPAEEGSHTSIPGGADAVSDTGEGSRDGDLTEPADQLPLTCDVCHRDGTHNTGRCTLVTSEKHGDTNTDPFCNCSCSRAQDRHGRRTHGLQRSRDSGAPRVQIVCAKLVAHWEQRQLELLFRKFVVERRRMAPLLVYTNDFCFIRLGIAYSYAFYGGEMPEELEGIWPYTKGEAIRHKNQLRQFYEIGMENMPAGELENLTMADIRARYDVRGGIPPQYRYQT